MSLEGPQPIAGIRTRGGAAEVAEIVQQRGEYLGCCYERHGVDLL